MESKYYTPEISDLFIGYEMEACSDDHADIWSPFIIDNWHTPFSFYDSQINLFRTPYLTKEQIINEGWEEDKSESFTKGILIKKKEPTRIIYYCRLSLPVAICISCFVPSDPKEIWSQSMRSIVYEGKCPSINEFRKICKLLEI